MDKVDSSEEIGDTKSNDTHDDETNNESNIANGSENILASTENLSDNVNTIETNDIDFENDVVINLIKENPDVESEEIKAIDINQSHDIIQNNTNHLFDEICENIEVDGKSISTSENEIDNTTELTNEICDGVNVKADEPKLFDIDLNQSKSIIDSENEVIILKRQIEKLEKSLQEKDSTEINCLKSEINQLKTGLETSVFKITKLQTENETLKSINEDLKSEIRVKLDYSKKQLDEKKREKESMVLKYAQAEQKCLDLQKRSREYEQKFKDIKSQLDQSHTEKERLQRDLKTRINDFSSYERELNNLKASITVLEQKLKTEETKFKDEIDKNKDVKKKHEELQRTIVVLREENNTLRTNCQEIVKTYQQSEDMKSNSLSSSLKATKDELRKKENAYKELNESHQKLLNELKICKETMNNNQHELSKTKERMKHIEADRLCQDESNKQLRDSLKSITFIKEEQTERIKQLEPLERKLENVNLEFSRLKNEKSDTEKILKENEAVMETISSKESEQLQFIQSLSDKNAALQSEKQTLLTNQDKFQGQIDKLERANKELTVKLNYWEAKYKQESVNFEDDKQIATKQVNDLEAQLCKLKNELSDAIDQNQSLQKKHKAHIKDLTKQLGKMHDNTAIKKQIMKTTTTAPVIVSDAAISNMTDRNLIERTSSSGGLVMLDFESNQSKDKNNLINISTSVSDDSSSCKTSNPNLCYQTDQKLEESSKSGQKSQHNAVNHHEKSSHPITNGNSGTVSSSNSSIDLNHQPTSTTVCSHKNDFELLTPEIHTINPHHQSMIDKIIRLQRTNAKLHEKIDFLNEHASQLTQEIQRKTILLRKLFCQSEESGSVKSEAFDNNHRMMARKSGIMASVFSSKQADQHMTLELSLQINRQLQSVLEDTALKNITLKDSINTLGEEVSKLSQENSSLKQNHQ